MGDPCLYQSLEFRNYKIRLISKVWNVSEVICAVDLVVHCSYLATSSHCKHGRRRRKKTRVCAWKVIEQWRIQEHNKSRIKRVKQKSKARACRQFQISFILTHVFFDGLKRLPRSLFLCTQKNGRDTWTIAIRMTTLVQEEYIRLGLKIKWNIVEICGCLSCFKFNN